MGVAQALLASLGGGNGTGTNGFGGQVSVSRLGATCGSRVTFNTDGTLTGDNNGIGTIDIDTVSGDSYWRPTTAGIGGSGGNGGGPLYLFVTATSGTFSSGTTGSWVSMASALLYTRNSPGSTGTSAVTGTFQVATDNAGANIIATGTITLSAEFA